MKLYSCIFAFYICTLYSMEDTTTTSTAAPLYQLKESRRAHSTSISALCLSNDKKSIFTGDTIGCIKEWDNKTYEHKKNYYGDNGHTGIIHALLPLRAHLLCSGSGDTTIKVWDILTACKQRNGLAGRCIQTLQNTHPITGLAEVPQQYALYSVDSNDTIKKWDLHTGNLIQTWQHPIKGTITIATDWASESLCIADKYNICIFDSVNYDLRSVISANNANLRKTAAYINDEYLYYVYMSTTVKKLKLAKDMSQTEPIVVCQAEHPISTLTTDELSQTLFTGLQTNAIEVFNINSGTSECTLIGHSDMTGHNSSDNISNLLHNNDTLYSTSFDSTLKIWETKNSA